MPPKPLGLLANFADMAQHTDYAGEAAGLLSSLIGIPSHSREEGAAADFLQGWMEGRGIATHRLGNNTWSLSQDYDPGRPTLLLNAHIDTVKPAAGWTRDPYTPTIENGRLYGLGSNDCGGGLVALLQAFRMLQGAGLPFNLVYLASAEEEVSGSGGISAVLEEWAAKPGMPRIDAALVGEPTCMQPAVAERGLVVVDLEARGRSGHAARGEGLNAIYMMVDDIAWLRDHRFQRVSTLLGPATATVTVVNAGTQHNVVPALCRAVVDVRPNELYTNEEIVGIISEHTRCQATPRSLRLRPSGIDPAHPLAAACTGRPGKTPFGSPTLSDQALMPFPSVKMGPGDSSRSHTADEYVLSSEISQAIGEYADIIRSITHLPRHNP